MLFIIRPSGDVASLLREKLNHAEENMSAYSADDLDQDWEFKIVRSTTSAFRDAATLQKLIDEEAQSGWVMLEKFDDRRVRFKRRRSARSSDAMRPEGVDPYRTQYGSPQENRAFLVMVTLLGLLLAIGLGLLVLFMVGGRGL